MQTEASTPSQCPDPDAGDRQRLYDVIIRFRLRPLRRPVGRWWTAREDRGHGALHGVLPGDDALDRVGRGVVVIDAIGRVLFLNRTAEWMLERATGIEVTQGGFLRLTARSRQASFTRYLVDSRSAVRREAALACGRDSLDLNPQSGAQDDSSQIVVTPLFDPPLTRLMRRSSPLHAVFVYEAPPRTPPTWAEDTR